VRNLIPASALATRARVFASQRWALEGLREARGGGSGNRIRPVKEAAATAPAAEFLA